MKSLSLEALWGEPGGRAPLLGILEGMLLSQELREKGENFLSGELLPGNLRET